MPYLGSKRLRQGGVGMGRAEGNLLEVWKGWKDGKMEAWKRVRIEKVLFLEVEGSRRPARRPPLPVKSVTVPHYAASRREVIAIHPIPAVVIFGGCRVMKTSEKQSRIKRRSMVLFYTDTAHA